MAKKSLKVKQQREQKFKTREYNRCKICGRPHAYIRKGARIGYLSQIPNKEKDNVKAKEVFYRGVKELIELENNINVFVKNMDSSEKSIKALDRLQEEFRIKGGYQLDERINKIKNGFKLSDELLDT